MDFTLRPLTEDDVPALQQVYTATGESFARWFGRTAGAGQAAADFAAAAADPARYQFGIFLAGDLVGLADCKLDEAVAGQAQVGLLLLVAPYDDPAIAGLALRILGRWLAAQFGVRRLEAAVPAHVPQQVAFWLGQGFHFTGAQYRREFGDFAPRFLVVGKDLEPSPGPAR